MRKTSAQKSELDKDVKATRDKPKSDLTTERGKAGVKDKATEETQVRNKPHSATTTHKEGKHSGTHKQTCAHTHTHTRVCANPG